jgi:hypothetical protein
MSGSVAIWGGGDKQDRKFARRLGSGLEIPYALFANRMRYLKLKFEGLNQISLE